MAESLPITFNDSKGFVEVTLHKSYLTEAEYGKISRTTVDISHIISRIVKENQSTFSGAALYHIAGLFKEGIRNALKKGESVSLFDLGALYPTMRGAISRDMPPDELASHIHLAFTPSEIAEKEMQNIIVKNLRFAEEKREIKGIYNLYDEQAEDKVLTRGMTAQITGTKLKLGGDKSGIYFAPVDNEQRLVKDSRLWVQADHITRNMPKTVEFFVPETLESGTSWRIVLETSLATNGVPMKSTVQIVSDVVQIQ